MKTIADELEGHWHKIAVALMGKMDTQDVTINMVEFSSIEGLSIVANYEDGGRVLRLRLMPADEAEKVGRRFQTGT